MTYKTINIKDINVNGPIRTPLLPEGFIKRIQKFKEVLAEVETTSLEQTVVNFQQDRHPERELKTWEYITFNYQDFTKANPNITLEEKKEVLKVLLGLSIGVESLNDINNLSKQQVQDLEKAYKNYSQVLCSACNAEKVNEGEEICESCRQEWVEAILKSTIPTGYTTWPKIHEELKIGYAGTIRRLDYMVEKKLLLPPDESGRYFFNKRSTK